MCQTRTRLLPFLLVCCLSAVAVSAVPWAEVWVDGELYDVTPFAKPIGLMPGRHTVEFRNRFFGNEKHVVDVEAGETSHLNVEFGKK